MLIALTWIGGSCYLLNKVFLAFSERFRMRGFESGARCWRTVAWVVYLIGLPPWVIVFIAWHNWIAAAVEGSGAPAMILGLVMAIKGRDYKVPRWLDWLAILCIFFGFGYSLYDFGGLTKINQWLEIGLVAGFLIGTYLLAKDKSSGYLWFVLMHVSCGWLMWIQDCRWMTIQQIISLGFIGYAYWMNKRFRKNQKAMASS